MAAKTLGEWYRGMAEDMQRLIERADSDKPRKARENLEQASGSKAS
jgi:hypothetical protein